jgi:3-hydroxyisobutyrate dehydrogenase-like beta-hydroxyacid dehydrogenase
MVHLSAATSGAGRSLRGGDSMSTVIAFCGLGHMGRAMAANLAAAGFEVRAWNRTAGKVPGGCVECATPAMAARGAEVAVSMLADDGAVEAVALGEDGLTSGLSPSAIHVSMSTISVALCERLAKEHAEAGQRFVSAPVFGRPEAAAARKLWIVPGGEASALAECQPLFAALGQGTFPAPTAPQASLTKLCGNFIIASLIEMFGEVTALAEKGGLDPARVADLLSTILFAGAPIPKGYAARVAATQFEPAGFAMPLGLKDVSLALEAAQDLRVPLPLGSLLRDHLLASLARGREHWDWGGLAGVIREAAGLPPTR